MKHIIKIIALFLFFTSISTFANEWHESAESILGWGDDGWDRHVGVNVFYSYGEHPFKEIVPSNSIGFMCEFYPMNETDQMTLYVFLSFKDHAFHWHNSEHRVTFANKDSELTVVGKSVMVNMLLIPYTEELRNMIRKGTKIMVNDRLSPHIIVKDYDNSNTIFDCIK